MTRQAISRGAFQSYRPSSAIYHSSAQAYRQIQKPIASAPKASNGSFSEYFHLNKLNVPNAVAIEVDLPNTMYGAVLGQYQPGQSIIALSKNNKHYLSKENQKRVEFHERLHHLNFAHKTYEEVKRKYEQTGETPLLEAFKARYNPTNDERINKYLEVLGDLFEVDDVALKEGLTQYITEAATEGTIEAYKLEKHAARIEYARRLGTTPEDSVAKLQEMDLIIGYKDTEKNYQDIERALSSTEPLVYNDLSPIDILPPYIAQAGGYMPAVSDIFEEMKTEQPEVPYEEPKKEEEPKYEEKKEYAAPSKREDEEEPKPFVTLIEEPEQIFKQIKTESEDDDHEEGESLPPDLIP